MLAILAVVGVVAGFPGTEGAFPVSTLSTDQATLEKLQGAGNHDDLATTLLLPSMRDVFKQASYGIDVEKGDVVITAQFSDTTVDDDCHHKIEAKDPKATGTIRSSSSLRFGIANITWRGATVFADARVESSLDIRTDVCVRVGEEIFGHHCSQIARDTVGIDVLSDGDTGLGLNLTASNAKVERVNGTWSLVFDFHASVVGTVLTWNVEKVVADNCKIKILGIEIASVCGTIESHVKDKAQALTDKVTTVTAPALLKKLEDRINTKIGSRVVIPLKIGGASVSGTDDGHLVV